MQGNRCRFSHGRSGRRMRISIEWMFRIHRPRDVQPLLNPKPEVAVCLKCSAPPNLYYVQDCATGLLVCEECGFAVRRITREALQTGDYIWILNADWPEFHSFEELFGIMVGSDHPMPAFTQYGMIPSRVLTAVLDMAFRQVPDVH